MKSHEAEKTSQFSRTQPVRALIKGLEHRFPNRRAHPHALCDSRFRVGGILSSPPKHQLQTGAIRIRTRHPALAKFEMRYEAFHKFLLHAAERRAVSVADHVMHGQELAVRLEPAQHRADVIIAALRI